MGRFLRQLRDHGFHPRVVVTDGSNLYPTLLASVWPAAEHQLCVFHVMQDIDALVLDAVKRLRRQQSRRGNGGRKRRRGRPPSGVRRRLTAKDKAHFVFKHRFLIVKRRENLSVWEAKQLQTLLEYLPALRVLRRFVDHTHRLLEASQTEAQAWQRYETWQGDEEFRKIPELAEILDGCRAEKFRKMIAFLRSPLGQRVRTNNHVERLNRQIRHQEEVRYSWRSGRGIVRFIVLLLQRHWQARQVAWGPLGCHSGSGAEPVAFPPADLPAPPGSEGHRPAARAA